MRFCLFLNILISIIASTQAFSQDLVQLGKEEIELGMRGARPISSIEAFNHLPTVWGSGGQSSIQPGSPNFKEEIQKRYGLFYDENFTNNNLPVGLTQTTEGYKQKTGFTVSCQACHVSRVEGKTFEGISNVFFDYQRLLTDLRAADGETRKSFFESNPDRNSMVSYSNYMGRLAIYVRNVFFPAINLYRLYAVFADPDPDNALVYPLKKEQSLRELIKAQSWVGYRYKVSNGEKGLYVDAGYHGSPAATHYALHFTLDPYGMDFVSAVQRFDQVGPSYLASLEPPQYPWSNQLDPQKVKNGSEIFDQNCSSCHGSFQPKQLTQFALSDYPGKLIDHSRVGTDPLRIDYALDYSNEAPMIVQKMYTKTHRYIAPPLIGIWARAPYLHNASVPNLSQLLNSKLRYKKYALTPPTPNSNEFDSTNVGWNSLDLSNKSTSEIQEFKVQNPYARVYDPAVQRGLSNQGHTFGDALSDGERSDLLEFLKSI